MSPTRAQQGQISQPKLSLPVGVDLVRFEKNLLQMGFFGAHDVRHKNNSTRQIEQTVTRDGQKIKVTAVFRSSLGLPSTSDRDKYLAFMRLAMKQKLTQGVVRNPIRFTGFSLLKELGVSDGGNNYEEINVWGQRMADTTITSEKVIYMAARKKYANTTVHVFRTFTRIGKSNLNGSDRAELFEVELEDWVLENFNSNYVVPSDFNAYCKLNRPTAKGVFGYLHLWFHASQGRDVERDYEELCMMLNIPSYRYVSKIEETMGKALDELISIGYLSKWSIRPMITKNGYKLVLAPGENLLRVLAISQRRRLSEKAGPVDASWSQQEVEAIEALVGIGITNVKAEWLVRRYSAEFVTTQAKYAMFVIHTDKRPRINNPGGFVIYAIESALPVPADFASVQQEPSDKRPKVSSLENIELQREYKQFIDRQIRPEVEARFPGDSLREKVNEILSKRPEEEKEFDSVFPTHAFQIGLGQITAEIKERLALPTFEEWRSSIPTQRFLV